MSGPTSDLWEAMATARTIGRFTDEPVDDATLDRCLEAATWAPSGANAQAWRFVVLRSPPRACVTSWASYGEPLLREAVGVPEDWLLAGHVVVGWPRGAHGPLRRRSLTDVVLHDHWNAGTDEAE